MQIDHLKPLYYNYAKIINNDGYDQDTKDEATNKYFSICKIFIRKIMHKFNLEIDDVWVEDNYSSIPGLAMALYNLFILDFSSNILEVIINYLIKNAKEIHKVFEPMKSKKDVCSINNNKKLSPEMAVIVSNIYEVCTWILTQIDNEEFFEYMDEGYLPRELLKVLYENGVLSGDFMSSICSIFKTNIPLKSMIGFDIMYKVRNEEIKDLF